MGFEIPESVRALALVEDETTAETIEFVPAREVRAGDSILVHPNVGERIVSEVDDEGDSYVVSYFTRGEAGAPDRLVEKSIKPLRGGDVCVIRRGTPERAVEMRRRLEEDERIRFAEREKWSKR